MTNSHNESFFAAIVGDGRPMVKLTGFALVFSGLFAFFLAATGHFLPHDIEFLGMTPVELCAVNECRIVHFMIHDRVAFGGSLIAVGTLYVWLAEFPLKAGLGWAWWTLLISGIAGFASFLAYLGYGYLDSWHGVATLFLLPVFIYGMVKTKLSLGIDQGIGVLAARGYQGRWNTRLGTGWFLLNVTAGSLILGGLIILTVGVTTVFVPQDLAYMGLEKSDLEAVNPRLVPLIAHDRAGFGGGVCSCGLTMLGCVWCGRPSRHLWQALAIMGFAGFGSAILVHPAIGYNDFIHLLPAFIGAAIFISGMAQTAPHCLRPSNGQTSTTGERD